MKLKFSIFVLACLSVAGCLIPDDYTLELSVPDAQHVAWTFDGKWQLILPGFDPRRDTLPPNDVAGFTRELMQIPGSKSGSYEKATTWRHSISWSGTLAANSNQLPRIAFPSTRAPEPMDSDWLIRIVAQRPNVVTIETPKGGDPTTLRQFQELGYKSKGVFTIKTPARFEQLSGPTLSKSWFGNSYSATLNLMSDQPISIRLTF